MRTLRRFLTVTTLALAAACAQIGAAMKEIAADAARSTPRPAGTVHEDVFFSPALGVRKHLAVYLPPSYGRDTTRRYSVAYYLHGLSGSETDWLSRGAIDAVADSLFSRGTSEMIIVMPDGDDGWWTTWTDQVGYRNCADTLRNESPERFCVEHQRYDEYLARDVVRHVDSTYRTKADRDNRGIAGLSMGGYGALAIALRYPDVFAAAASHSGVVSHTYSGPRPFVLPAKFATTVEELRGPSGAYYNRQLRFWGTDIERWRANEPAHLAEQVKRTGKRMPALFFDCGREDGFIDQNRALHSELDRLGIRHQYAEWPGAHTWRYWTTHMPESLAWLGRQIS